MATKIKKISMRKYVDFLIAFYDGDKYKGLRLGQAFLNEFFPDVNDPQLFHSETDGECLDIFIHKYVATVQE